MDRPPLADVLLLAAAPALVSIGLTIGAGRALLDVARPRRRRSMSHPPATL